MRLAVKSYCVTEYIYCRDLCERLADLSDTLIRDVQDSLILQPAYLDIATTKRKADEARFFLITRQLFQLEKLADDLICVAPPHLRPTSASSSSTRSRERTW